MPTIPLAPTDYNIKKKKHGHVLVTEVHATEFITLSTSIRLVTEVHATEFITLSTQIRLVTEVHTTVTGLKSVRLTYFLCIYVV